MARSSTWRARLLDRAGAMTLSLVLGAASAVAQTTQAPAPAPQAPPAAQPAAQAESQQAAQPAVATEPPAEAVAPAGDITGLVAPIALYPDPLLALVLQASTLPLEVVQADRFLAKRASDPSLTPDAGWDSSILGLLNYPQLIQSMSEYLDWTQDLGDAVVDRLPEVQDAIAQIRWSAYTSHILVSNDSQNVILDGNYIRIMPAKNDQVSIPTYDPVALMAAIEQPPPGAGEGAQPASATTSEPAEAGTEAASGAAQSTAAAEPSSAETTQPATSGTSEAPAATAGTEAAAPVAAAPAAPATYAAPAPAYAAAPPVVAYSEPQSSFWSSAAPFLGGAAVGGLLGYVIGDDDNNNNHNNGGNRNNSPNIKIEDSNVVVGGRNGPYRGNGYYGGNGNRNRPGYPPPRYQPYGAGSQQNVQRELQQRRQRASAGPVSPVRQPTRAVAGVPVAPRTGGVTRTTTTTTSTSVRVPRDLGKKQATSPARTARNEPAATRLPGATTTGSRPGGQVGAKASAPRGGMASNVTSKTRADAASQRGASSRAAAAKKPAAKTTRPAPKRATAQRSGGGGFQMQSGKSAKADSARGKQSRKQGRKGGGSRKKG